MNRIKNHCECKACLERDGRKKKINIKRIKDWSSVAAKNLGMKIFGRKTS